MSIDGNWIRKNETKEGVFFETNIQDLKNKVRELFDQTRNLFKQIEFYLTLDSNDLIISNNSFEVRMIQIYVDSYIKYCDFDLNDIESMKYSINGFTRLIQEINPILEQIKIKTNLYYKNLEKENTSKTK